MSDDRLAQARVEAVRRYPPRHGVRLAYTAHQVDKHVTSAFVSGAMWADANPQPHTITRGEYAAAKLRHDNWRLTNDSDLAFLAGLQNLGIEVADDEWRQAGAGEERIPRGESRIHVHEPTDDSR